MPLTLPRSFQRLKDRTAMQRWGQQVKRIIAASEKLHGLSEEELRKQSLALRFRAQSGESLDRLLVEAYALVRESGRRFLNMEHYPVQLLGGISIHHGSIAVMQTGEGKTLTATLPIYLAALAGQGAHLATANDYLAQRDAELMKPLYESLGLSIGVVTSDSGRNSRRLAYEKDITYSTAKEIGFDFLRDRLHHRRGEMGEISLLSTLVADSQRASQSTVQRELNFMLVDEADSILIDEARTPLIVSSLPDEASLAKIELYRWAWAVYEQFEETNDFRVDPKNRQITLLESGRRLVRRLKQPPLLRQTPILDIYEQIEQTLFVAANYLRDRQYVVRNEEVVIVDEFTGRLAEGRKWRAGLHQTIEAREGIEISVETGEAARITIQDLFLRYQRISGMTGTAASSAFELRNIYNVRVLDIPTNRPPQRVQWPDLIFGSDAQKWNAIAEEVDSIHRTGRPILVGTRSIDKSDRLAELLTQRNIPHETLNARELVREAQIVAHAGHAGRVTVATNMAGRGTDIKVEPQSLELGGLHVICSELHESARIDRQLIGRCGRQGDPGSYRQFLSLEDEILSLGLGAERASKLLAHQHESPEVLRRFAGLFRKAQSTIENRHFEGRKILLHQEKLRQELQREMGQDPYLDSGGA